ncbi:MAG: filamentous hemagglutinin N-terminal domain-containing protein, partial [Burkholderiales bacterium]|nr:filamentous hemagglutinin N-terminal domain-containing protein [Burkholderiales bacterium]
MNAKHAVSSLLRRKALVVAVASCFAGYAQANPTNPTVISGAATFAASGKTLTVTNTPGSVINWQGFSVKADELTRFIQQNAQSAVLNRVVSQEQSAILGQLQSNGRVYLINPNGITIGAGARIDTAGFVASSLNLSDSDALAGKFKLQDIGSSGKIINNGTITTATGGFVYLVAPDVENNGIITSPKGEIILAAGKSVELVDSQKPELRVELTAPENTAINVGKMIAEAGSIGIFAGTIKQSGLISANSVVVGENGKIMLKAKKDITLAAGSKTEASGPQGGSIRIESESGAATIAGAVEATGTQGKGGSISVAAPVAVTVAPTARVSADGIEGGSVTLTSSAGPVTIAAPVTANATVGRAGQVAVSASTTAVLASAGQLGANGGQGGGAVSLKGSGGVTLDLGSVAQASGATGGSVAVHADQGAVEASGTLDVTGHEGAGGSIQIAARSDITLDIASRILASGRSGGEVRIESGEGTLLVSGLIDGRGSDGQGGRVLLLAPRVGLMNRAVVSVSGQTGGGTVLVGGNFHGSGPEQNASATYIGPGASINADATGNGNGGSIALWSEDVTRVYGSVSARGGAEGGNGGFVETSSHNQLDVTGMQLDLRALRGQGGNWLIDPYNVTINAGATGQVTVTGGSEFASNATGANIDAADIIAQLNGGTSVTITTAAAGAGLEAGDITQTTAISKTAGGDASLTMTAAGTITIGAAISSTLNKLNVTLRANDNTGGTGGQNDQDTASGNVVVSAAIDTLGGTFQSSGVDFNNTSGAITTSGGNVTLTHTGNVTVGAAITTATGSFASSGVIFNNTTAGAITTGGGDVTINHSGMVTLDAAINAAAGNATIIGDSIVNGTAASTLTAGIANLVANTTIGVGGAGAFETSVNTLNAVAGGNIAILESNAVTLGTISSGDSITITNTTDDITLGTASGGIVTALNAVSVSTTAGDILDGTGAAFTNISVGAGGAVTLSATAGARAITSIRVATDTPGTYNPVSGFTEGTTATVGAVTSAAGTLRIYSPGDLTMSGTLTAGGAASLIAVGNIAVNDVVTTTGNFDSSGVNFTNTAAISTNGGNVTIGNSGLVAVNAAITTLGGSFTSTAGQGFSSTAAGVITTTAGAGTTSGHIDIDVSGTGTVDLAGDLVSTGANNGAGAGSTAGIVTIDTVSGTIAVNNITASGGDSNGVVGADAATITLNTGGGATITLNGNLTAKGGAGTTQGVGKTITVSDAALLGAGITIDTGATAGDIVFLSTLDGTAANTQTLGLTAGTGDVSFSNTVGAGTALGAVTISSAKDVGLT